MIKRLTATEAMTKLGMSKDDFLLILREKKIHAYRIGSNTLVDIDELLENKRHAVLKRRVWESPKAQWRYKHNVPGWNSPDDEDFGGPVGRVMFREEFRFQQHNLPPVTPKIINEILSTISVPKGEITKNNGIERAEKDKKRDKSKDIKQCRDRAKKYVTDCKAKKETPSIAKAIKIIHSLDFGKIYTEKQIRNWIIRKPQIFPEKSSKKGRRKNS